MNLHQTDCLTDLLHHALLEVPADQGRLGEGVVLVTLGERIDAVAGHLLLPGPLDSLRHCAKRCCIVLEKLYYSPMPRL